MFKQDVINAFKKKLGDSKTILILLPPDPSESLVVSGLGLFSSLEKAAKNVQIGCSSLGQASSLKLQGVDRIKSSIGNQNLIINFKFKEENLDKVDYDIDDEGNFQLMIRPKPNSAPPDTKDISYTYSGASADLVITLGINSLEELGKLYSDEKSFLDKCVIASLNKTSSPASFAAHNFHTSAAASIAEITSFLLFKTETKPAPEAANFLLKEIYSTTNNLNSPRISADTFETIAFLIKNGARPPVIPQSPGSFPLPQQSVPTAPVFTSTPPSLNQIPPAPIPPDWKKPKIFRSS